jgi:hypothetical protein
MQRVDLFGDAGIWREKIKSARQHDLIRALDIRN